ncbi:MAG: hypothetical protein Q7S58_21535 [Candidatus Binatus sp.]|uniref:hypothetical protein n=1 Tax=Candidatus Binatus sp. TaxID=2811406 RepID=UPI002729248D|nr:hypothetical protein [Candidatus Binatus sp.]MDO8434989.1 hypothetical protein [Candidatus Binatus sp.]
MPRKSKTESTDSPCCPVCSSANVVPIMYGLPAPPMPGEPEPDVEFGGCMIFEGKSPRWFCRACEHRWGAM